MIKPDHVTEIFLQPGDFYFGDKNTRIRTLLGSCVSITMWHPMRLIGGMCHYMLPYSNQKKTSPRQYKLDGRYAEEAILMFFQEAARHDTDPKKYVVKVFGAGSMSPEQKNKRAGQAETAGNKPCVDVPCRNIAVIRTLSKQYGFHISAEHLGGDGHRNIVFDIWSGNVWVRKSALKETQGE